MQAKVKNTPEWEALESGEAVDWLAEGEEIGKEVEKQMPADFLKK
jgi:hypothetical protein